MNNLYNRVKVALMPTCYKSGLSPHEFNVMNMYMK